MLFLFNRTYFGPLPVIPHLNCLLFTDSTKCLQEVQNGKNYEHYFGKTMERWSTLKQQFTQTVQWYSRFYCCGKGQRKFYPSSASSICVILVFYVYFVAELKKSCGFHSVMDHGSDSSSLQWSKHLYTQYCIFVFLLILL